MCSASCGPNNSTPLIPSNPSNLIRKFLKIKYRNILTYFAFSWALMSHQKMSWKIKFQVKWKLIFLFKLQVKKRYIADISITTRVEFINFSCDFLSADCIHENFASILFNKKKQKLNFFNVSLFHYFFRRVTHSLGLSNIYREYMRSLRWYNVITLLSIYFLLCLKVASSSWAFLSIYSNLMRSFCCWGKRFEWQLRKKRMFAF